MNKHDLMIKELLGNKKFVEDLNKSFENYLVSLHFNIALRIRNTYIWKSREDFNFFLNFYHVQNADDASMAIIRELLKYIL